MSTAGCKGGTARDRGCPPTASTGPVDELVGIVLAEVIPTQALLEVVHGDLAIFVLIQHLEKLGIYNASAMSARCVWGPQSAGLAYCPLRGIRVKQHEE